MVEEGGSNKLRTPGAQNWTGGGGANPHPPRENSGKLASPRQSSVICPLPLVLLRTGKDEVEKQRWEHSRLEHGPLYPAPCPPNPGLLPNGSLPASFPLVTRSALHHTQCLAQSRPSKSMTPSFVQTNHLPEGWSSLRGAQVLLGPSGGGGNGPPQYLPRCSAEPLWKRRRKGGGCPGGVTNAERPSAPSGRGSTEPPVPQCCKALLLSADFLGTPGSSPNCRGAIGVQKDGIRETGAGGHCLRFLPPGLGVCQLEMGFHVTEVPRMDP